jgi:hypothetical protein
VDARQTVALAHVDLSGPGLEIGPSYSPLVPKSLGVQIETVDHASKTELVDKYTHYGLTQDKLDNIDQVDHIWSGGTLVDTIGKPSFYEYIVAAHVIEHSVDLIGFLQDCEALLRPGGRLALVVPDKRYCFDLFKPLSSLGAVVDAHLRPTTFHTPGALLDHTAYDVTYDNHNAWSAIQTGEFRTASADLSGGAVQIEHGVDQATYYDAHRWIFTPASLSLLVQDLAELGYHSLHEVGSAPTNGFEFYVTLSKSAEPTAREPRVDRLLRIQAELLEVLLQTAPSDDRADSQVHTAQLRRQLDQAQAEIEALRASTSWRVTAPLRQLSELIARVRRNRAN